MNETVQATFRPDWQEDTGENNNKSLEQHVCQSGIFADGNVFVHHRFSRAITNVERSREIM